ncbi:MAG: hypothetical protein ACRDJU_12890 [Actinomycetota bacterium]
MRPIVDPLDPNAPQIFGPSFLAALVFNGDTFGYGGFRVRRDYTVNEAPGLVGNQAWIDNTDAGDFDVAQVIQDADLLFIYKAPNAGRVQLVIDAISLVRDNTLSIADEFGFSGHWTSHNNYLTFMVYHPNTPTRALAQMAFFHESGSDDHTWTEQSLTPGAHYYALLTTDGAVEEGDTVFASVGTRSMDLSYANDVDVHNASDFRWLIRTAEVRIVT